MIRFDIITIFPDYFRAVFDFGIVQRARRAGLIEIGVHDLREWTTDRHRIVDDRPFGGGEGMVLKPEPIFAAVKSLTGADAASELNKETRVVLLSPQGQRLSQELAGELARQSSRFVLICGRYEGVDERVAASLATDEISIGDYVLSGGEPAAIVLIDAIVRLVPGALGNEASTLAESFTNTVLDFPHYTRPEEFNGMRVPEVLLGGNHAEIARWRRREALRKTERNRPDLLERARLSEAERAWLNTDDEVQ